MIAIAGFPFSVDSSMRSFRGLSVAVTRSTRSISNWIRSGIWRRWFRKKVARSVPPFRADDLAAAHRCFSTRRRDPRYAWGLRGFGAFLQAHGLLKASRPKPLTRSEQEVNLFLDHLRKDRGAAESTRDSCRRRVRHFLKFLGFDRHKRALQNPHAGDRAPLSSQRLGSVSAQDHAARRRLGARVFAL